MRSAVITISFCALALAGCGKSKPASILYAAGDKATVGPLVYSVIDTEVTQQLGEDPNNMRTAQERFFLVKVSVTNSSSDDQPIPSMTLVDDSGHNYAELADGTGVPNWFGVLRRVHPAETQQGVVIFDAPTRHYRLRLNDALDDNEVAIDVPLNFVHEQMKNVVDPTAAAPQQAPQELPIPRR